MKREICNLAPGDLPAILKIQGFVINKFESEIDASVVDCLLSSKFCFELKLHIWKTICPCQKSKS